MAARPGTGSRMVATLEARVADGAILRTLGVQRGGQGGHQFGPATGRFGPWVKNKVCSSHDALHFLLSDYGH
jgi:hypothetical protein